MGGRRVDLAAMSTQCAASTCSDTNGLKSCTSCDSAQHFWCECQKAHWETHRTTCRPPDLVAVNTNEEEAPLVWDHVPEEH